MAPSRTAGRVDRHRLRTRGAARTHRLTSLPWSSWSTSLARHDDEIDTRVRRLLAATNPGVQPPCQPRGIGVREAAQPSYAGTTNETYLGAERRLPDTVTASQVVSLRRTTGERNVRLLRTPGKPRLPAPSDTKEWSYVRSIDSLWVI